VISEVKGSICFESISDLKNFESVACNNRTPNGRATKEHAIRNDKTTISPVTEVKGINIKIINDNKAAVQTSNTLSSRSKTAATGRLMPNFCP
jgi:hypothetical protein